MEKGLVRKLEDLDSPETRECNSRDCIELSKDEIGRTDELVTYQIQEYIIESKDTRDIILNLYRK